MDICRFRASGDGVSQGAGRGAGPVTVGAGPEVYLLHTTMSGWSAARYERWLAATIDRLLLA